MKIVLICDHAGFELRNEIKDYLKDKSYIIKDLGPKKNVPTDSYADFIESGVKEVLKSPENRGIFICGAGIGVCIGANRFKGIRAGSFTSVKGVKVGRFHNNLNVLCLGGRVVKTEKAIKLIETFLTSPYEGGRHDERNSKIDSFNV